MLNDQEFALLKSHQYCDNADCPCYNQAQANNIRTHSRSNRKDNARLNRKTMCHSKRTKYHDAHIDILTAIFNYCRPNKALKELINPDAKLFETKYKHKSPAMAEGLIDKILTIKELLCWRPPKVSIL